MKTIKGILLDVDGTLYHQKPIRVIMAACLAIKFMFRPKELFRRVRIVRAYRNAQEILRFSEPLCPHTRQRQLHLTRESTDESNRVIEDFVHEWFETRPLPFLRLFRRRGLCRFLDRMRRLGIQMAVFSDYPAVDKLGAMGVRDYFSDIISSDGPGIVGFKPYTNGFKFSVQKMGLSPEEVLYIGDRPEVDGVGAAAAGMPVIILGHRAANNRTVKYAAASSFPEVQRILSANGLHS